MTHSPMALAREPIEQWVAEGTRGDCIFRWSDASVIRVLLADATGHDARSAAVIRFLSDLVRRDLSRPLEESAFRRWNRVLYSRFGHEELFACFTTVELDRGRQIVRIANGGNPDLLIYRTAGDALEHFQSTGMPLGILPAREWAAPRISETALNTGDCVVCFSDGLIDRVGRDGNRLGVERVCQAARAGGRRVMRVLRRLVLRFSAPASEQDDLSVVLLRGVAAAG